MKITLPLPNKNLSPNARCHWRVKAKATKRARADACIAGYCECRGSRPRWSSATVQATFFFRSKIRRDRDNLLASLKAVFDGLADSGLIANDSGLTHLPVKIEIDKADPRVELMIEQD